MNPQNDPRDEIGLPADGDFTTGADADFDLLMRYLDGELAAAEAVRLDRRLGEEPELAAALGRMGADHAVRRAVWRSLEPTPGEALVLARQVARATRRAAWGRRLGRVARFIGAAAACAAVGFLAGWVGRGNAVARAGTGPGTAVKPAESFVYQVALTDEAGNVTAVQKFDTLDDARNFAADLGRWQAEQQRLQDGPSVVTPAGL